MGGQRIRRGLATGALLGFFALSLTLFGGTLVEKWRALAVEPLGLADWLQGRTSAAFETAYEQEMLGRDIAVQAWGALRYGLFHTGSAGVVIGKHGWLFTTEEFESHPDGEAAVRHKITYIAQVRDILSEKGIGLVIALIPAKARLYAEHLGEIAVPGERNMLYPDFLGELHNLGIVTPDLLATFEKEKPHAPLFMRTDTHWSPTGAALAAGKIADAVRTGFPDLVLETQRFDTDTQSEVSYDGDLNAFIPTGMFKPWIGPTSEPLVKHTTNSVGELAGGLFGNTIIPVALVGTSYSYEPEWNFAGALRQALQADVLNIADEGEGPLAPMQKFLKETDFEHHPPALVIWEIPERFLPVQYDHSSSPFSGERQSTSPKDAGRCVGGKDHQQTPDSALPPTNRAALPCSLLSCTPPQGGS